VPLTIGKIASLAKVSADTLRYYEQERLVKPAAKSESGYRLYERDALQRIRFIKQAQQCGFSLAEIRALLTLRRMMRRAVATCAGSPWKRSCSLRPKSRR